MYKSTIVYDTSSLPIKQINVRNGEGYFDLIVNKNNNGRAIRISSRQGEPRVHVTLDSVDALITALQTIRDRGMRVSVNDIETTN